MFARRHPLPVALALAVGGIISLWLKPDIEQIRTHIPAAVIVYVCPLVAVLLIVYLLIRSIEDTARLDYETERIERIKLSKDLELTTITLGEVRRAKDGVEARLVEAQQGPEELEESPHRSAPTIPSPDVLNAVWLTKVPVDEVPEYRYDPIYGVISIDGPLLRVFRQPIVQRLSHVRQLSFSYLTFPTATHTRLAHSLGVCKMAELALSGMFNRGTVYSSASSVPLRLTDSRRKELLLKSQLAALLHDLGHGPFGHALDKYVGFFDESNPRLHPDKEISVQYIMSTLSGTLEEVGFAPESIAAILDGSTRRSLTDFEALIADIIDSPLDVDRMDYLFRDGIMTGLTAGYGSLRTLLEMMRPFQSDDGISLAFDEAAVPAIENLLYLRDFLYVNCYELPPKLAAERAFERVAEEAISSGLLTVEQLMLLTDANVLSVVPGAASADTAVGHLAQALLTGQKYEQVYFCKPSESANPEVKNWVTNRLLGNVGGGLRQAYVVIPRLWERRIAELSGVGGDQDWQVLVSVPSYFAYVQKESGARVLVRNGQGWSTVDLFEYSKKLGAILEQMRPASSFIRVFASAATTTTERERIRAAAASVLG
jgi:HD superfamily phosphohydrolase